MKNGRRKIKVQSSPKESSGSSKKKSVSNTFRAEAKRKHSSSFIQQPAISACLMISQPASQPEGKNNCCSTIRTFTENIEKSVWPSRDQRGKIGKFNVIRYSKYVRCVFVMWSNCIPYALRIFMSIDSGMCVTFNIHSNDPALGAASVLCYRD